MVMKFMIIYLSKGLFANAKIDGFPTFAYFKASDLLSHFASQKLYDFLTCLALSTEQKGII